jgi:Asp-tRNA(Asn)/Glu-tRNA(Gln) amidotransferase B subunit
MSILEKAKSHYQAKLHAEPSKIQIPEWDTEAYIKPAINLHQLGEIMELSQSGKTAEAMALTLIYRLIDDEGKPIFRKAEKTDLMRSVDPDVLARIVGDINASDPSEDDVAGN